MSKHFDALTQPGRIGKLALRNRMVVTAMGTNLAEPEGFVGPDIIHFHRRQAQGGIGLIITGVMGVAWPHGSNLPRQVAISDDRFIPGLQQLTQAVHEHGAKIAAQLHHGGMVATEDSREGRPIWVPAYPEAPKGSFADAFLPEELAAMAPPADAPKPSLQVMTQEDINALVTHFTEAARRAQRAGFDGVEIHGGHGYILSAFLSPRSNNRDDDYGGSLENRARLLLDVIRSVRNAVGDEFGVWCKLDSQEFGVDEGISVQDARATARLAEAAGADAITVSAYHDTGRGRLHSESNIPHTPEHMISNATAIKEAVNIPVIASGRVEPENADTHIAQGHFDFLAMGRKMLADPDLPKKIQAGTPEDIRPCVYCYCCVSQIYVRQTLKCAVNPETGKEQQRNLLATDAPRSLVVVGGGPAGMEAALRLSQRGFRVTLMERSKHLGGTLQFAGIAYAPNEKLLRWQQRQLEASTVDIQLGTEATPATIAQTGAEEVIIATGAKRDMPDIPGAEREFVFSGDEMRAMVLAQDHSSLQRKTDGFTRLMTKVGALTGATRSGQLVRAATRAWLPLGQRIVIIGSELVGLELAEFLALRGRRVTVVDESSKPGKGLYLVRRMRLLDELHELGVTLLNNADEIGIGDYCVSYRNYRGQQRSVAADNVIVAKGASGDSTLAEQCRAAGLTTHEIGDCRGVSYIEGAIESAAELAVSL